MKEINTLLQSMQENSFALGLSWGLRPATVQTAGVGLVSVIADGDVSETTIEAVSLVGYLTADSRVMLLMVPPASIYIVGFLGGAGKLQQVIRYTGNGVFAKLSYPGLYAVHVRSQGGGGAGGSCALTAAAQSSCGGGGGGGGYCEQFILAGALGGSETVTIGAGGTPAAAGNNAGGNGAATTFGAFHSAGGGNGGQGGGASGAGGYNINAGGSGGTASGGDLSVDGQTGGNSLQSNAINFEFGIGGVAVLGHNERPAASASSAGNAGRAYGSGGGAAFNAASQAAGRQGGAGAAGICIVEVYV